MAVKRTELECSEPVFVLSLARSGSTLLRRVLDAHPALACPPETNLCDAFAAIARTSAQVHYPDQERATAVTRKVARRLATETMGEYMQNYGKERWCDKSLPTYRHVELIQEIYPEARFICLYRYCTDVIASVIEASPYGYAGFGIEPYMSQYPSNTVQACAAFWAENTAAIRGVEDRLATVCHRVRYEDLVRRPDVTMRGVYEFLALPWRQSFVATESVFTRASLTRYGDYKTRYRTDFDLRSVGRGWHVPLGAIAVPLLNLVNEIGDDLDYPPLGEDVRAHFGLSIGPEATGEEAHMPPKVADVESVSELFETRIKPRIANPEVSKRAALADGMIEAFHVKLMDTQAVWVIDPGRRAVAAAQFDVPISGIRTDSQTLLALANGTQDPGVAVRLCKVQFQNEETVGDEMNGVKVDQYLDTFDRLLDLVRPE